MAAMTEGKLASDLRTADKFIHSAIDSFPDREKIYENLVTVSKKLNDCEAEINAASDEIKDNFAHRITLKQKQIGNALYEASGLNAEIIWDSDYTSPSQEFTGKVAIYNTGNLSWDNISLSLIGTNSNEQKSVNMQGFKINPGERKEILLRLMIPESADYHHPLDKDYEPFWDKENFSCVMGLDGLGHITLLPANPVLVVPPVNLSWEASGLFYNKQNDGAPIEAMLSIEKYTEIASDVEIGLDAPEGWTVTPPNYKVPAGTLPGSSKYNFVITGPTNSDRLTMTPYAICDGRRIEENVLMMNYDHIRNTCKVVPNTLAIQPIDLQIPKRLKVGYVDRGSDRVYFWMQRFGVDVAILNVDDLKTQDLSVYDTIVIGIRAFAADLTATSPFLREYVENGGNLVTQYNRTDDDWDNDTTPPRPITIGSPSFRWRITDPNAVVTYLVPNHHLLNAPNKLNDADWANWHQERGLYFAADASNEYEFLLSMSDHGKDPLKGALISGKIGDGWHHHCTLILHHQLEHQVPGAARLLANLITPPDWK
jgi:hypothetical protein